MQPALITLLETAKKRKTDVLEETDEANNENTDNAAGSKKQKLDDEAEEENEAEGNIIIQKNVSMQDA